VLVARAGRFVPNGNGDRSHGDALLLATHKLGAAEAKRVLLDREHF
jgi:hypothetical protein